MESSWYLRQLATCEQVSEPRFDLVDSPGVVHVGPLSEDERSHHSEAKPLIPYELCAEAAASQVRDWFVAMLLARGFNRSGRWLDVYVANDDKGAGAFRIVPARGAKRPIARLLREVMQRRVEIKEGGWIVYRADMK
jgi:hypothetical protein